jgi:hypothetical protein
MTPNNDPAITDLTAQYYSRLGFKKFDVDCLLRTICN